MVLLPNGYVHSFTGNILLNLALVIHNLIVSYDAVHYHNIRLYSDIIFPSSSRFVQLVLKVVKFKFQRCSFDTLLDRNEYTKKARGSVGSSAFLLCRL